MIHRAWQCGLVMSVLLAAGCAGWPGMREIDVTKIGADEFEPTMRQRFVLREGAGEVVVELALEIRDAEREIIIERGGKRIPVDLGEFGTSWHMSAAVVPLYEDGDALLIVVEDHGTGYDGWHLWVVNPRRAALVGLDVVNPLDPGNPLTQLEESANFRDEQFAREAALLHRLKHQYHYRDETALAGKENDGDYAEYFWRKDNGKVTKGPLKIRRLTGEWSIDSRPQQSVTVNGVRYTAAFKHGVYAYDAPHDESFVVFYPQDMYGWPDKILAWGPYVLVLPSEDFALIDTRTFTMVRLPCEVEHGKISGFEVRGREVVLSEGTRLGLPSNW